MIKFFAGIGLGIFIGIIISTILLVKLDTDDVDNDKEEKL